MMSVLNPRVSVIIPAYNAERFIRETLDSVLAQTYPNIEIVVSDDGSTDGTRACVAAYGSRVGYVRADTSGGGPSRTRNAGIRASTGTLLVFIDADDLMVPGRIAAQVEFFARHPSAGVLFSDYQEFGPLQSEPSGHFRSCPLLRALLDATPAARDGVVLDSDVATEFLLTENFGSSSPMLRRHIVDRVGGYDESLRTSEDFEFQFRVAQACPVGIDPRIQWHKRQHPLNASADTERILIRKIDVRRRFLETETVARRRRKLKQSIASWHADLAYFYTGRNNVMALRHLLSAWRFMAGMRPRLVARLALDALGRKTPGVGA